MGGLLGIGIAPLLVVTDLATAPARIYTWGLRCRLSSLLAVNLAVKWPCKRVKRTRLEANALVTMVGREGLEPPTPARHAGALVASLHTSASG